MSDEERRQAGILTSQEYAVVAAHANRGRQYDALLAALRALEAEMRTPSELATTQYWKGYAQARYVCADRLAALLTEHGGA